MIDTLCRIYKKVVWVALKHPLTLVLICVGMLFEFIVSLPFAIMCRLDSRVRRS